MYSKFVKFCSVILTIALLINLLPMQVLGEEFQALLAQPENVSSNVVYDNALDAPSEATIIGESVDKRTEFSKEFKLSNGMSMIVVYPEAVHFEKDNAWEEIDNTLVTNNSRGIGTYRNKNNSWNVSLPQQLSATNKVTVEKDGYVVSFGMAGEKRRYIGQVEMELLASASDNVLAVTEAARTTSAQVVDLNYAEVKSMSAHPETVADTLQSRVQYTNVYQNTDIQYDLNSYQLKESIILHSYNSAVRGYDFLLETGGLNPVLLKDNSIELQTAQGEAIMTLPAPYMIDNDGAISKDVGVTLTPSTNGYLLSYQMPMEWLADTNRAWPVVLDPVIVFELYRQNIKDQFVAQYYYEDYNHGAMYCGYNKSYGKMRSFLRYVNIPELTSADVIVHAELSLYRLGGSVSLLPIEAHKVTGYWDSQTITWANQPGYNPIIEDYCQVGGTGRYSWEITDIVKDWYNDENENSNTGVMLKAPDSVENGTTNFWKKFYTVDYDIYETSICPQMYIYFKNSNGIESYWDYTSASAGRAGTGYVNNYSGNLTWVHNDIGFGGNRMPVSINHVYNTNDSADNIFGLGHGWRTNFNQTVGVWSVDENYYFWEDGDGTKHYFKHETGSTYKDEDGLELTLKVSNDAATVNDRSGTPHNISITDKNGNASYFDSQGRLCKFENNQPTVSSITITYPDSTGKLISTITDGVGRRYNFTYTNNLLSRISYVGKVEEGQTNTEEISYVTFGYTGSNLTSIVDKDRKFSLYTYSGNYLTSAQDVDDYLAIGQTVDNYLTSVQDIDGYKLQYSYFTGLPKRVVGINESDDGVAGGYMTIGYAHNQTTFTDHNGNVQILQFNDWGNLIAIQDDRGRAQYAQYARNEHNDNNTSKANQMSLSSKMQNTVSNIVSNSSFEQDSVWYSNSNVVAVSRSTETAYLGSYSQKVVCSQTGTWPYFGAFTDMILLSPGATITVSAYIKTVDATVTVGIERQSDCAGFDSEIVPAGKDWSRYQVSYTNTSDTADTVRCFLYFKSPGTAYIDCVQAEYASTASRYNIIENGDFRASTNSWSKSSHCDSSDASIVLSQSAAPQMEANVFRITGSPTTEKYLSQTLNISGSEKDNYVLTGWAKADSVPLDTGDRTFGLELRFRVGTTVVDTHTVDFNADCKSTDGWQYVALPIVANTNYDNIEVCVCYSKNANTAYFDGIQLFKETFGTSYTYDDDGNVTSVVDLQNEITEYRYTNNNLTQIIQNDKAKMRYEYDTHHNVIQAITQKEDDNGNIVDGIVYNFTYDTYGNNTSVEVVSGGMSMSSLATYTDDGNYLETTEDTLENTTTYCYNENTGVLEWVQYPNDTNESKTTYDYDDMYRIKTALQAVPGLSEGTALTASYTYNGDLLTAIRTASTAYSFTYGAFDQRTGVSIGDRTLASYSYTDDLNRYLDKLTYGNGDYTEYDYDNQGRLTLETFEDNNTVSYTYDNIGALSTMTDSATGRKTTYYYDLIDRLGKYKEVGPNGYEHSVTYTYDERNNLSKMVETINGVEHVTDYTYDYENRLTKTSCGDISETVRYDGFGRFSGTEAMNGGYTVFSSTASYASGNTANTTTSRLRNLCYESIMGSAIDVQYAYDKNGNIIVYSPLAEYGYRGDPDYDGMGSTRQSYYYYDTANQLVREDSSWLYTTFIWTYDDAGNITSRTAYEHFETWGDEPPVPIATYTYTYSDSTWGDLLTAYNGVPRTYDTIGNLLTDGTWTYTWQNGRELASITDGTTTWNYTYDANGMRTSRTNGTKTYNYVYNGSQLTQMTVGNNTLYFTYGVLGPNTVTWNGTTYYYALSGQGDVTGIYDAAGNLVVFYYWENAWGYNPFVDGPLASTLGALNPLRYRSYVYDSETGYYYLQSRYYDPEIGRFINADALVATGQGMLGNNMFAYCRNNPVRRKDVPGTVDVEIFDDDSNPLDDDRVIAGGTASGSSFGGNGVYGGKGSPSGNGGGKSVPGGSANGTGSGTGASSVSSPANVNGGRPTQNIGKPGNNLPSDKVRTPDQQALHDLAREIARDARQGKFITQQEAELLDSWAKEYGVYQHHGAVIGSGEHWITGWNHTHIYNIHVPFVAHR